MREYQSSQEALEVLEAHLAELEDGDFDPMADATPEQWDDYDREVEATNDAAEAGDPEKWLDGLTYNERLAEDDAADVEDLAMAELAAATDEELLGFLGEVIHAVEERLELPITETDVRTPQGEALVTLVQSGTRLIWGKLISVVNRRTRYAAPLLASVEFPDGIRRLVSADDILISDTFAAA
jgi:hypothetical protein